jgi:hypothetical protein
MASRKIEDLYKDFQPLVRKFLDEANQLTSPWQTFITDGFRSFEEQDALFAQGRTTPGKIVTNARGGQSWHNYGLAVDVAFQKDGKLSYDSGLYAKIAPIGKRLGFIWGGDWKKFIDKPHFAWHPDVTLAQAQAGKRPKGDSVPDKFIQVQIKDWEKVLSNSLICDDVYKYVELSGDPAKASFEEVQRVIGGFKSRSTDLQNKLTTAETEVKNRTEQVGRLKERLLETAKLHNEELTKLKTASKGIEEIRGLYEARVKVLEGQLDVCGVEKGKLAQKIAELQQEEISPERLLDIIIRLLGKLKAVRKWMK